MMTLTPSNALLARYLAGECSVDETREVAQWALPGSENERRLNELRALWVARPPLPAWDVTGMWTAVQRSMRAERRGEVAHTPLFGRVHRSERWLGMAVAAVAATLLIMAGVEWVHVRTSAGRLATAAVPMHEYTTARGQRATVQLPDGSRLVLAPDSRVQIPATFGRAARDVILDGEALFDVVHDATRPFRVRAKYAVAQDLGTRFDVRAYTEDSVVSVAVVEGAVALGSADAPSSGGPQGVVLGRGELGTLSRAGQVTTARGQLVADQLAWTEGRLVFTDVPLHEVVVRLGRWYNVQVVLASPELGARRVTAPFQGESALEALRFVASFLNLTIARTGDRYTLYAK